MFRREDFFCQVNYLRILKGFDIQSRKNNLSVKEHEIKLMKHNIHKESCQHLYHRWRTKSMQSKEDFR
jgi:hypothetical protein